MSLKKGKCINIGNGCNIADNHKIVEIPDGSNFICPDCGSELLEVKNGTKPVFNWKKVMIPLLIILVIGVVIYKYSSSRNATNKENNNSGKIDTPSGIVKPPVVPTNCPPHKNLLNSIKERGINIVMEEDSPPMYFVDTKSSKLAGFGYEFAKGLTSRMNIKMNTPTTAPFDDLPKKLCSGEADIIIAGEIMDPEIKGVIWTDPFLESGLCLITRAGYPITDYKGLSGKKIRLFKGDRITKEWVLKNIPNVKIDDDDDKTGWLEHLSNNECDAIIYDYVYAVKEIKNLKHPEYLAIRQFNIQPVQYSIPIPEGNVDLLVELNKQIASIKSSSFYEDLYKKYLSADINMVSVPEITDCKLPNCYLVKKGDNLGSIAKMILGNSQRYMEIFNLNKDRIPSPHFILIGVKLRIP